MAEFAYRTLPETWHTYTRTGVTELTKPSGVAGSGSFDRLKVRLLSSLHLLEVRQRLASRVTDFDALPSAMLRNLLAQQYAAQILTLPSSALPAEVRDLTRYLPTLTAPALRAYLLAFELWQVEPHASFTVLFDFACDTYGLTLNRGDHACLHA